jgi:predicted HTH domain antitoxin
MADRTVELTLPEEVVRALAVSSPREVEAQARIALAIDLFTRKAVSLGKAAELAGTDYQEMIHLLKERGIPAFVYDSDTYAADLKASQRC